MPSGEAGRSLEGLRQRGRDLLRLEKSATKVQVKQMRVLRNRLREMELASQDVVGNAQRNSEAELVGQDGVGNEVVARQQGALGDVGLLG